MHTPVSRTSALRHFYCISLSLLFLRCSSPQPQPFDSAFYVWQQRWTPELAAALSTAAPEAESFAVLAGLLDRQGEALRVTEIQIDWAALASAGRPARAVFRIHALPDVEAPVSRARAVDLLKEMGLGFAAHARQRQVPFQGVELDYDCPTSKLSAYADLLKELRSALPEVPLSATILPTWLGSHDFRLVANAVDHFVLQVHALQVPKNITDEVMLCDTAHIPGWARQAASFARPFHVALPTYGYRLFFSPAGEFTGIAAEDAGTAAAAHARELWPDPVALAEAVLDLQKTHPPECRGIIWFRLPVEGDRMNWNWPMVRELMAGHAPEVDLKSELRQPESGLYEVWVRNEGAYRPEAPMSVSLQLVEEDVLASDALGGFSLNGGRMGAGISGKVELLENRPLTLALSPAEPGAREPEQTLTEDPAATSQVAPSEALFTLSGPAPDPGEEKLAAWFRCRPNLTTTPIRLAEVELQR